MSTFYPYQARCPSCRHTFVAELARGLHITRLPQIRQQLLDGTFQVFTCPACKQPTVIEATVVYTDFERFEYVAVETSASAKWQAALARHKTVFRDCFEHGPPIAHDMGAKFKRRVVYGFRALREKLLLWDAGLDDRVVEAVKADLVDQEGESPRDVVLRLSRVLEGGHLLFAAYRPMVAEALPEPTEAEQAEETAQLAAAVAAGMSPTVAAALKAAKPPRAGVVALPAPFTFLTATADRYFARAMEPGSISRDVPWLQDDWFIDAHDGPSYLYR